MRKRRKIGGGEVVVGTIQRLYLTRSLLLTLSVGVPGPKTSLKHTEEEGEGAQSIYNHHPTCRRKRRRRRGRVHSLFVTITQLAGGGRGGGGGGGCTVYL